MNDNYEKTHQLNSGQCRAKLKGLDGEVVGSVNENAHAAVTNKPDAHAYHDPRGPRDKEQRGPPNLVFWLHFGSRPLDIVQPVHPLATLLTRRFAGQFYTDNERQGCQREGNSATRYQSAHDQCHRRHVYIHS